MTISDPTVAPLLAVTFDLDGLMFNSEELYHEVGATLLARRGKQITGELLDQMMGRQAHVALGVMIDWHKLDATPAEGARPVSRPAPTVTVAAAARARVRSCLKRKVDPPSDPRDHTR